MLVLPRSHLVGCMEFLTKGFRGYNDKMVTLTNLEQSYSNVHLMTADYTDSYE